jgi:hypothetical protein
MSSACEARNLASRSRYFSALPLNNLRATRLRCPCRAKLARRARAACSRFWWRLALPVAYRQRDRRRGFLALPWRQPLQDSGIEHAGITGLPTKSFMPAARRHGGPRRRRWRSWPGWVCSCQPGRARMRGSLPGRPCSASACPSGSGRRRCARQRQRLRVHRRRRPASPTPCSRIQRHLAVDGVVFGEQEAAPAKWRSNSRHRLRAAAAGSGAGPRPRCRRAVSQKVLPRPACCRRRRRRPSDAPDAGDHQSEAGAAVFDASSRRRPVRRPETVASALSAAIPMPVSSTSKRTSNSSPIASSSLARSAMDPVR